MKHLFDANVLIAVADTAHTRHPAAFDWFRRLAPGQAATCPTVENALLRYLVRIGVGVRPAWDVLAAIKDNERVGFVEETHPMAQASLIGVLGYRQITDVYLCQVATSAGRTLATYDQGLCQLRPEGTTNLATE